MFLVVTTIACLTIGIYVVRSQRQAGAVQWCVQRGGSIDYDSNYDFNKHVAARALIKPSWIDEFSLRDYFSNVVQVRYRSDGSDPAILNCLNDLDMLVVRDAKQCDLEILSSFPKLVVLQLLGEGVEDISLLSDLTSVEQLGLQDLHANSLQPLAKLELESLIIFDSQIKDFSAIKQISSLKLIIFKDTPIKSETVAELKAALPQCMIQVTNQNRSITY